MVSAVLVTRVIVSASSEMEQVVVLLPFEDEQALERWNGLARLQAQAGLGGRHDRIGVRGLPPRARAAAPGQKVDDADAA